MKKRSGIYNKALKARYKKNILIKDIGPEGQLKLSGSRVAVIGLGGLGSAVSLYLAAAGVGELIIVDNDAVELKDLQRQIIYDEGSTNMPKTAAAGRRLKALNSRIKIKSFNSRFEEIKKELIKENIDIIADCVDNIEAKFNLNDFSVEAKIPFVHRESLPRCKPALSNR